jgi:predicted ribosome quality control (RQC) complex YloA/Tae2 family protein
MTDATMKRKYTRRTEEERIRDLEAKIEDIKQRQQNKEKRAAAEKNRASAIVREVPKVKKRLLAFSQLAMDSGRMDIANSVTAFLVGLDQIVDAEVTEEVHWSQPLPEEDEEEA